MRIKLLHTIAHEVFYERIFRSLPFKFFLIYSTVHKSFYMVDFSPHDNLDNICKLKKL